MKSGKRKKKKTISSGFGMGKKDLVNADKPPHARTHTGGDIEMREASGKREREKKKRGG
jgi:hypothetical protein